MRRKYVLLSLVLAITVATSGCNFNFTKGDKSKKEASQEETYESVVEFSQAAGIYEEEFELVLSTEKDGEIYYTLDGSDPATSDSAILYEDAIKISKRDGDKNVVSAVETVLISGNFNTINDNRDGFECDKEVPSDDAVDKCTVVRTVVKYSDGSYSNGGSQTYFIGSAEDHIPGYKESLSDFNKNLAVMSITMNYDDLFDYETGIYVKGKLFDEDLKKLLENETLWDTDKARRLQANYNQRGREWERDANVDMFELGEDGKMTEVITQNCGIRVQGNYSRSDWQKGFRLYAREEYGKKSFKYPVFGDNCTNENGETIDKFNHLVLRAGGNCAFNAKFNDTYWQSLAKDCAVDTKTSRPCVVYLNGEYWGVYVLEEDYDDDYFEDHYGVNKDDVIVYKGDAETYSSGYKLDIGEVPENESERYYLKDLIDFNLKHKDVKDDADYEELCKLVDKDSFIDYLAIECFINNKWDWPGKNWSMWKTKEVNEDNAYSDGRWRLSLYDVEFGGISGKSDAYTNTIKEDNYQEKGLLDRSTSNPVIKTFATLMTNDSFRAEFEERLLGLSEGVFEKSLLLERVDEFESAYIPLLDQFFERYPNTGSASDAKDGGYASVACLRDFIEERENNIQPMIDFCEDIMSE